MRYLSYSIVLHLVLLATLLQLSFETAPKSSRIEVEYIDPSEKETKQIVSDINLQPLQKSIEQLKEKVNRLSRETQRVENEQIARRTGPTQNQAPRQRVFPKPKAFDRSIDPSEPSIDRPMNSQAAEKVVLSESTIAEYIPEVKEGGFTSLNTDQFLHYTFYARINEQIRNRWVQHLRTFSENAGPIVLNRLSQKPQITELEVLLDKDGNFHDIIFHRRAEHSDLDVAAGAALERSAPFLNPPSEIIKDDGFIHLYYAFYIHWRPQYIARPSK